MIQMMCVKTKQHVVHNEQNWHGVTPYGVVDDSNGHIYIYISSIQHRKQLT